MNWTDAIRAAINGIPHAPYGNGFGVSRDIALPGLTLRAKTPPQSICSGAQAEAFFTALRGFPVWSRLSAADAREMYRGAYARTDLGAEYADGLPGVLVRLGYAEEIDVHDVRFGDLVQIQWHVEANPNSGHAVVAGRCAGGPGSHADDACLWAWSANIPAAKYAENGTPVPSDARRSGHQWDYFLIDVEDREFTCARPLDSWLNG